MKRIDVEAVGCKLELWTGRASKGLPRGWAGRVGGLPTGGLPTGWAATLINCNGQGRTSEWARPENQGKIIDPIIDH